MTLPNEVLEMVVRQLPTDSKRVQLVCKRVYPMVVAHCYASICVGKLSSVKKLFRTLRLNAHLASLVGSLDIEFRYGEPVEKTPVAMIWSQYFPPVLPRCTELLIQPIVDFSNELCMPLPEILSWVSQCPQLSRLRIDFSLGSSMLAPLNELHPERMVSANDLDIDIPPTLRALELINCFIPTGRAAQFWTLLSWAKELHLFSDSGPSPDDLDGINALDNNLRVLEAGRLIEEQLERLALGLTQLEVLRCSVTEVQFEQTMRLLQVLEIDLDDLESLSSTLDHLRSALQAARFPVLQKLKLSAAFCKDLKGIVEASGVATQCARLHIALDVEEWVDDPPFFMLSLFEDEQAEHSG